ncbi:MAG: SulP family inorganic anion transporter, partial [Bacteroidales bacterium]|nr:SulP family inorganic anion transporter [Bacteroidales bacterium]
MSVTQKKGLLGNLKHDIPASIVVFLVAVPLCLGIALASGAPLFSGVIAGIIGGIVVGAFSGSQLGVSGPAAGLAVIVLSAISELGSFEVFLTAVVISGVLQLILGYAKAGIIGYYFPSSVIKGMLSGIGIIIILKQIPHSLGYDKDFEGSMAFAQPDGHNTLSELYYMFEAISPGAAIITLLSMVILILWERPFMKKIKLFNVVQGPLVVVALGIILNLVFQSMPSFALKTDQVVAIPVASSISGFFGQFTTPDFSRIFDPSLWLIAA